MDTNTSHADNNNSSNPHITSPLGETDFIGNRFKQLNCGKSHTNADTLDDSNVTGINVYQRLFKWTNTKLAKMYIWIMANLIFSHLTFIIISPIPNSFIKFT